jgi:hypothetical protein
LVGLGLTVVLGLELGGRDVAEGAVEPGAVEPVDPGEGRELDGVDVSPGSLAADDFGLEQAVDRLGEGVDASISVN